MVLQVQNNTNISNFAVHQGRGITMRAITSAQFLLPILGVLWMAGAVQSQPGREAGELRTVVIDPGHGGSDPGAVAGGVREKDLVLAIGLRLGNLIKESYPEVKVVYTRSKDLFIPLHTRASLAMKNKADLFISLHANWVAQTSVRGTETFTLGLHRSLENLEVAKKENSVILLEEDYTTNYEGFNPNETESYIMFENMQAEYQTQSITLAACIQNEFTKNLKLINRGVKQAGFLVLRQTSMPSVLVEVGFISHPAERKFLTSEEGKTKVAESIFKAFSAYKKIIDSKSNFTVRADKPQESTPAAQPEPAADTPPQPVVSETPPGKQEAPPARQTAGTNKREVNKTTPSTWYSVQVSAIAKPIEPDPANFKGEKNIIRIKVSPWYKYFAGKFDTVEEALAEQKRLRIKFPEAFLVVVENGVPRALSKSEYP